MTDDRLLDMDDPHEAHAVFALEFNCEACGATLEAKFEEKIYSNAWYRRLASLAKAKKWYAPPASADGSMDVMSAWCPDCATRLGFTTNEENA
jgi:hypothetical protein